MTQQAPGRFNFRASRYWPINWPIWIKILAGTVSVVVLSLGVTTVFNTLTLQEELRDSIGEQFEALADARMEHLAYVLDEQLAIARSIALIDEVKKELVIHNNRYDDAPETIEAQLLAIDEEWRATDSGSSLIRRIIDPDRNQLAAQLIDYQETFPSHVEIFITDREGALVAATNRTTDYYQADEDWWTAAYNGGEGAFYISQLEYDESAETYALLMAVPVTAEDGEIIGVVRSTFNVESIHQVLGMGQFDETGHYTLANNEGVILSSPREKHIGKQLSPSWQISEILETTSGRQEAIGREGRSVLLGYVNIAKVTTKDPRATEAIHNLRWILFVSQSQEEAYAPVNNAAMNGLLGAILFTLVAVAVSIVISRGVVAPITRLVEVARRLTAGELNVRAPVSWQDETGELAEALNTLADNISESLAMLESRVAGRTRGLLTAAEVSSSATGESDVQVSMENIADITRDRLELYYVGLFLLDETNRYAELRAGTGEAGAQMLAEGHRLEVGGASMIGQCTAQNRPYIAEDVAKEAAHYKNPHLPDTRSELALPLRVRGRAIGAMTVQSVEKDAFGEEDVAVLQTIANQVAGVIQNAQLFAETQNALKQTEAALAEAHAAERRLVRDAWTEYPKTAEVTHYETKPLGDAVLPEVRQAMGDQNLVVEGANGQAQADHAALVTSIKVSGLPIGALGIHDANTRRRWTDDEKALLEAVAERLSLAIENRRLDEKTQSALAETETLYAGSDQVIRATTFDEVLHALIDSTVLERMDRVNVLLFDRAWGDTLPEKASIAAAWERSGKELAMPHGTEYVLEDFPFTGLLQPGQPLILEDVTTDVRVNNKLRAATARLGSRSVAFFPIVVGGQWIGLFAAHSAHVLRLGEVEVRRIVSLVDQAGTVIQNRRLLERTRLTLQDTEALYQASARINTANTLGAVLDAMLEGTELPFVSRAAFGLYNHPWVGDDVPEYVDFIASWDERSDDPIFVRGSRFWFSEFSCAQRLQPDTVLAITDVNTDPHLDQATRTLYTDAFSACSMIFVPLVAGMQWIGHLTIATSQAIEIDETSQRRLIALAGQAAVSIQSQLRFEDTQIALREARSLYRFTEIVSQAAAEPQLVYDAIAHAVVDELQYANSWIALLDEDAKLLRGVAGAGAEAVDEIVYEEVSLTETSNPTVRAVQEREPVVINEPYSDTQLLGKKEKEVRAFMGRTIEVPVLVGARVIGVIAATRPPDAPEIADRDVQLFQNIVTQASVAIQRAQLFEQMQATLAETRELYRGSEFINKANTFEELLDALRQSTILNQAEKVTILLFNRPWAGSYVPEWVYPAASWVDGKFVIVSSARMKLDKFSNAAHLQSDEIFVSNDIAADNRLGPTYKETVTQANFKCALSAPLVIGEQWVGFVEALGNTAFTPTPSEERQISTMITQAAVGLRSQQLFRQTQESLALNESLYNAGRRINEASEIQGILAAALEEVPLEVVNRAVLMMFERDAVDEKIKTIIIAANWYSGIGTPPDSVGRRYPFETFGIFSSITEPVAYNDIQNDARIDSNSRALAKQQNIQASAMFPLWVGARQIGILALEAEVVHEFTERETQPYTSLAQQMATRVDNLNLFTQTQETLEETNALYQGSASFNTATTLDDVLSAMLEGADLPFVNRAALVLFSRPWIGDDVPEYASVRAAWDEREDDPIIKVGSRYKLSGSASSHFLQRIQRDEIFVISDLENDPRVDEETRSLSVDFFKGRGTIFVPLLVAGRWIGYFNPLMSQIVEIDETRLRRLMALAGQASIAIQSQLRQQQREAVLRETSVLYEATQALVAATNEQELLAAISPYAMDAGASAAGLIYLDPDRTGDYERALIAAELIVDSRLSVDLGRRYYLADFPFTRLWVSEPDNLLLVGDIANDERLDEDTRQTLMQKYHRYASAVLPLRLAGRWVGAVVFNWPEPQVFDERDERIYSVLRDQAAVAIDARRLLQDTEARAHRERVLRQIATRVRATTDPDAIVRTAVRELGAALERSTFVRLGTAEQLSQPPAPGDGDSVATDENAGQTEPQGGE